MPRSLDTAVAVRADDLSLARNGVRVIDGVTFTLATAASLVVMGPTGSGKTSLASQLAGRPDEGLSVVGGDARATQLATFMPGNSHPPGPGTNSVGLGIFRYETDCGTVYGHTGNIFGYTQFMAGSEDGTRAVVVSANQQMNEDEKADVYEKMARANELAVCAAFADGD